MQVLELRDQRAARFKHVVVVERQHRLAEGFVLDEFEIIRLHHERTEAVDVPGLKLAGEILGFPEFCQ